MRSFSRGDNRAKNILYIRIDPQSIRRDRLGKMSAANHVRIAAHGAGEIAGALTVDGIGVPDAPDVEAVAHLTNHRVVLDAGARFHHDVRAGRARTLIEST